MWGVWGVSMLYDGVNQFDLYVCSLCRVHVVNVWCGGRVMLWEMYKWYVCGLCVFGVSVVGCYMCDVCMIYV